MSAVLYDQQGYCYFGGHWSEQLHRHTKSCRECEDASMMRLLARRKPDTQGY